MSVTPLLLALLVSAVDRPAASPLAGCRAPPMGEHGSLYECSDATALRRDGADANPEVVAGGMQGGYAARLGDGAEKDRTVLRVGGADVSALRARSRAGAGWALTLRRPEGTRILGCLALRGGDHCGRILDHMATEPWRAGVAAGAAIQAAQPLQFDGRPVPVPKGCETLSVNGASGLPSPSVAQATWAVAPDEREGRRIMEQYATITGANLRRMGIAFTQGAVACSLGSTDTTCARILFHVSQRPQVMLWAMARVRDQLLVGYCTGPSGAPLPEPCSFVFA